MPLHASSTCAHRHEVKLVLYSLWYNHTYRCDYTRGIITPIGVIIPEAVKYNFALLTMSTCARNMHRHEINSL